MERVTIIGTGLIGGSIGLALKAAKLPGLELAGYDDSPGALSDARKRGAIDVAARSLDQAVSGARMVIIATPPLAARGVLQDIAHHVGEGTIVTDTLSTKAEIMRWAHELLPAGVSYVGGHPMAGKETTGVGEADAGLFREKAYCIIPSAEASEGAVKSVLGLIGILGAEPVFIDADEHDQYVAAISHLPIVASSA
ncbi:MAG: prephenate dehydrogenase, partial [Dehalococcoidia bacterium]